MLHLEGFTLLTRPSCLLVIFPNGLPSTVTELRGQSKEKTSEEEQHSPHAHSLLPSCAMNAAQNKISANNLLCTGNSMYTLQRNGLGEYLDYAKRSSNVWSAHNQNQVGENLAIRNEWQRNESSISSDTKIYPLDHAHVIKKMLMQGV